MNSLLPTNELDGRRGSAPAVLKVRGLEVAFETTRGSLQAVRGVDLSLGRGEVLAVLGESGSGKSVTAEAIMGIIDSPPGFVRNGTIELHGDDLLQLSPAQRRRIQGARLALISQDPLSALNPVYTVGWQIAEIFKVHRGTRRAEAYRRAADLLHAVGISDASARVHDFPHQFSGGMRQRVMIAMAMSLEPDILIADEPTTALDVTVQAQILQLLARLRRDTGMGILMITHDIAVAAEVADRIAVMYAGRIVEEGPAVDVLTNPAHPYTDGLLHSVPRKDEKLIASIGGAPPEIGALPSGCTFHPRCPLAEEVCTIDDPQLRAIQPGRRTACHFGEAVLASEGR